ncbi:hypothetical protein K501DRAFT_277798 [Backusella circina FSU 941]|nr:hypothetical protein K501DRAFT_277798 [Backusella circina FSU 941]
MLKIYSYTRKTSNENGLEPNYTADVLVSSKTMLEVLIKNLKVFARRSEEKEVVRSYAFKVAIYLLDGDMQKKVHYYYEQLMTNLEGDSSGAVLVQLGTKKLAAQGLEWKSAEEQDEFWLNQVNDHEFLKEFKRNFELMETSSKWKLSDGVVIEDKIYQFGLKCSFEQDFYSEYDPIKHDTIDWIYRTLDSIVPLYEKKLFKKSNNERWYQNHLWIMINRLLETCKDITVVRGEITSESSSLRKDQDRLPSSIEKSNRKSMDHRQDMMIMKNELTEL